MTGPHPSSFELKLIRRPVVRLPTSQELTLEVDQLFSNLVCAACRKSRPFSAKLNQSRLNPFLLAFAFFIWLFCEIRIANVAEYGTRFRVGEMGILVQWPHKLVDATSAKNVPAGFREGCSG